MKQINSKDHLPFEYPSIVVACFVFFLSIVSVSYAQTDSTNAKESSAALISPTIVFTSIQKADNTVELKLSLKAKQKGNISRPAGVAVEFFLLTDSGEVAVGKAITDIGGIAKAIVKEASLVVNKEGKLHFRCTTSATKLVEAGEEEISVRRGRLVLTANKQDSILSVTLKLTDRTTNKEAAIAGTDLSVYVKRMINPLKIGEGKTDTTGEVMIEIPSNLPGDPKGNLELIARLDDNEDYGAVEASIVEPWGTKVSNTVTELPRALWSTHPPIWMLVTFIILVTVVWGHYFVIMYELFRLRKEH